jgi:hypothetical protein
MLTLALIAPLDKETVLPLLVNVVHANVPKFGRQGVGILECYFDE